MRLSATVKNRQPSPWNSTFNIVGLLICNFSLVAPQFFEEYILNPPRKQFSYTSFQGGRGTVECTALNSPFYPTTIEDLHDNVLYAIRHKYHMKAVGSLLSTTDAICTDGILVHMVHIKHFSFDPRTNYATAGAGLEIQDFLEHLHNHGRALTGAPSFGGITVGGAVGTGAHGTNLKQAGTLSDQLVSITFVDGLGAVRTLSEGDRDFKAMKVHLGLLGIIYECVFKTTEQYKLQIKNYPVSDAILWNEGEILRMAETNDWFQFLWVPTNKQVILSVGNRVPLNTSGNCESHLVDDLPVETSKAISETLEDMQGNGDQVGYFFLQSRSKLAMYEEVPGRTPFFTEEDGSTSCLNLPIGYSHRMTTSRCKICPWHGLRFDDGAVAIDVDEFSGAINTLKEIMDSMLVGFPLSGGLVFRFLTESDAYLGLSNGRKSVDAEWTSIPRQNVSQPKLGIGALQAMGQALVEKHGGRPHWGKNGLYYTNPKILQDAHPNLKKFVRVMKRLDPNEVFMNEFGMRLKYGDADMTLSSAANERCALNEACLCKEDSDCGDDGPGALVCGDFKGFKVCKKPAAPVTEMNERTARNLISSVVAFSDDVGYVEAALSHYKGFEGVKKQTISNESELDV